MALFPNLNAKDKAWRTLLRDVRFRRALSMGLNRREINQVVYYGLATEANNTVTPDGPCTKSVTPKLGRSLTYRLPISCSTNLGSLSVTTVEFACFLMAAHGHDCRDCR